MASNIDEFKIWLVDSQGLGSRTAHTYYKAVKYMLKRRTLLAALRDDRAASTKHTYWAALKQWSVYTDNQDFAQELMSPAIRKLAMTTGKAARPVKPYTDAEVAQFREALDKLKGHPRVKPWVWPIISLFMRLGLRARVDLCRLTKDDIIYALQSGRLTVRTKKDKFRILPVDSVREELEQLTQIGKWKKISDIIAPTSIDPETLAYRYIVKILKQIAQACGMDPTEIRSHRFRHTAAMELYKASDHDILLVQKFLGHSRLETTIGYLRIDRTDEMGKILNKIKNAKQ